MKNRCEKCQSTDLVAVTNVDWLWSHDETDGWMIQTPAIQSDSTEVTCVACGNSWWVKTDELRRTDK